MEREIMKKHKQKHHTMHLISGRFASPKHAIIFLVPNILSLIRSFVFNYTSVYNGAGLFKSKAATPLITLPAHHYTTIAQILLKYLAGTERAPPRFRHICTHAFTFHANTWAADATGVAR